MNFIGHFALQIIYLFLQFQVIKICLCAVWNVKCEISMRKNPFQMIVIKLAIVHINGIEMFFRFYHHYYYLTQFHDLIHKQMMEPYFRMANGAEPSINQIIFIFDWGTGVYSNNPFHTIWPIENTTKLNKYQCSNELVTKRMFRHCTTIIIIFGWSLSFVPAQELFSLFGHLDCKYY